MAEQEPHRQHVCVHVLKTAQTRRCMCDSLRPGLKRPQTKTEKNHLARKERGSSCEGNRKGSASPTRARAGRKEKMRGPCGRESGEPDGHGGGQGSRSSGRRLGEECAQPPGRRGPGQSWSLRSWSGLLLLTREPFRNSWAWAWAWACYHTYPHGCPHLHLQFVLLQSGL